MNDELNLAEILLDIRDRTVRIETKMEAQAEDVVQLQKESRKHGEAIRDAKTSLKVLRWVLGVLLLSMPATVAAVVKIFKG